MGQYPLQLVRIKLVLWRLGKDYFAMLLARLAKIDVELSFGAFGTAHRNRDRRLVFRTQQLSVIFKCLCHGL